MSEQSRDKKDKALDNKEPWELPEKRMEQPQTEESQTEEPQAEELQTEESQTEESQTEESQTEEFWTEELWTQELWPEEPHTEKPRTARSKSKKPLPKRAKPDKKQRIIMIVMIVLAVIMVIAASLALLYKRWVRKPTLPPGPSQSASGSVPSAAVPSINPSTEATSGIVTVQPLTGGERKSKDFYTVLIFGMDTNSGLTDTIMVASYDVTNQKATVMSIPRDTLINNIYLDKANKSINATYKQNGKGENGAAALKAEISQLIGFVPDYYVTINWELVGKMVDAIGGVYFDIPYHMGYDDPTQNLHIHFEAGYQYLDGTAAMSLVRWRKNNDGTYSSGGGGDLSRLNIQHNFLKAVLKQTLQPQNIIHVPELIRLFNENVVSDLAVENMLWFGQEAVLGGLRVEDVQFVTMPVRGSGSGRYNGKVCPIPDQLLTMVNSSLNPYVQDVTLQQLDLIQINPDGNTLFSTTGTLRNPAAGVYTYPTEPPDPTESSPGDIGPTEGSPGEIGPAEGSPGEIGPTEGSPGEIGPTEGSPGEIGPAEGSSGEIGPAEDDPKATDPAESNPDPAQTDDPPPAPGPTEAGGNGPADGDWGDTPD